MSSRASATNASRLSMLWLVGPASTNRRNKRLSFASLRQIFTRMRKSFFSKLSASIQLAATDPEREPTAEYLPHYWRLGNCFTNVAQTLRSERPIFKITWPYYLPFEGWELVPCCLGFGAWDLGFAAGSLHVENNPVGLNGCDSLAHSRVAPAGNP